MIGWILPVALGLLLLADLAEARANAGFTDVPAAMRGVWGKYGRCDVAADRLTIGPRTAGWGRGLFEQVGYSPDDQAVFWAQDYDVDNFVAGRTPDFLVHNTQGFHMPGSEGYARCGRSRVRLPWPYPKS